MFTRAIVRPPAPNFSHGLTTSILGAPDYDLSLKQHGAYCAALEEYGLTLTHLDADADYPDSTFVEDTAVVTERCAVLARPGAPSRAGEVMSISLALSKFYPSIQTIDAPGTLDGGDVCQAGDHFFIGVSERTNEPGAQQLADFLARFGYTSTFVDIRSENVLHLKSGLAYLGDNRLVVTKTLARRPEFKDYELLRVHDDEAYAANSVRVNDHVLLASGYPTFAEKLRELGYETLDLDMSEFQKMDGGLSCLSLRF